MGWVPRAITLAVMALHAGSILLGAWLWAYGGRGRGLTLEAVLGLGVSFVIYPAVGLLGVVWAIVSGVTRWERRWVAAGVLLVSLGMGSVLAPTIASDELGKVLLPFAQKRRAEKERREHERYLAEKKIHYEALLQHFRTPRRVVQARAPHLVLDDSQVVKMIDFPRTKEEVEAFAAWAPEGLVGREVRIVLPSRELFERSYSPGGTRGRSRRRAFDRETGKAYGDVPAFVLLDGDLVSLRFTKYPEQLLEFYQRSGVLNTPAASRH